MKTTIKINGKEYGLRSMGERVEDCYGVCPLGGECRKLLKFQPTFCEPLFAWSYYSYKTPRLFVLEEIEPTKDE